MDNIDELLANAEEIDYLADDIQFLIDENLRTVTIPPDGVVLGVEGDKNSNRVNFQMPRYYNGFDMSEFTVRVNYVNANGDGGVYTVNDLEVRDDMILFTWLVDSDACAYIGVVRFLVRMTISNGGELIQAFDTTIAKANVLEGLPITTIIDEEDRFDIILHLMSQVDDYVALKNSELDLSRGVGQSTAGMEFDNGEVGQNGAERFNDYDKNMAVGQYSHAEGHQTYTTGPYSHAEGWYTSATGICSHAEGYGTVAAGNHQHVIGRSNIEDTENKYAFVIGNGAETEPSNAFAIDWDGKIYVGDATEGVDVSNLSGGSGGVGQNTEGKNKVIGDTTYEGSATSEIFNNYERNIATNTYSHAEGTGTAALAYASHAEGSQTTASGYAAHAEGENTIASGSYAHAEGWETTASGSYSHVEGYRSKSEDYYSHAEGQSTTASGMDAHAEGYLTIASGDHSHAEGQSAKATNTCAHAEGSSTTASGWASHAEGESCTASEQNAHAEGYTTTASGRAAHAEGYYSKATNNYAHAEGYMTESKGYASHAEGYHTIAANVEGQHAMGKNNVEDTSGKYAFIIGNGKDTNNRSNAFCIDWNGLIYVNGAEEGVDVSNFSGGSSEELENVKNGGLNDGVITMSKLSPYLQELLQKVVLREPMSGDNLDEPAVNTDWLVVRTLSESDLVLYGLSSSEVGTGAYPYTNAKPYNDRLSYPYFDIPVEYGYIYKVEFTTSLSEAFVGVHIYNQTAMDIINVGTGAFSESDRTDSTWQLNGYEFTIPYAINNSSAVCTRFTFKSGTGSETMSIGDITSVTISRKRVIA